MLTVDECGMLVVVMSAICFATGALVGYGFTVLFLYHKGWRKQ